MKNFLFLSSMLILFNLNVCSQFQDTLLIDIETGDKYFEHDSLYPIFTYRKVLKNGLNDGHYIFYRKYSEKKLFGKRLEFFDILIQGDIINGKLEGEYVRYEPEIKTLYVDNFKDGLRHGYSYEYYFHGSLYMLGRKQLFDNGVLKETIRYSRTIPNERIKELYELER